MTVWGKLILTYALAAAAALCAAGTAAEVPSPSQWNLSSLRLDQPLVQDVYWNAQQSATERFALFQQLAAFKMKRAQAIGSDLSSLEKELTTLKGEHRNLMATRNGVGRMDDSVERWNDESGWDLAVTQNVGRQALVRSKMAELERAFAAHHSIAWETAEQGGKQVLVRVALNMELQDGQSSLALR